jgi:hypothetical protein
VRDVGALGYGRDRAPQLMDAPDVRRVSLSMARLDGHGERSTTVAAAKACEIIRYAVPCGKASPCLPPLVTSRRPAHDRRPGREAEAPDDRSARLDQTKQGCPGDRMAARAHGTWILEGEADGVVGAGTLRIVTPTRLVQPAGPNGGASAWGYAGRISGASQEHAGPGDLLR